MIYPIRVRDKQLEVLKDNNWKNMDRFLKEETGSSLSERYAVLAVGSNACPARLADPEKYGNNCSAAIPVFHGWINDVVSVYIPHICNYGSIPSTIMGKPGAKTKLWVTLLSEMELRIMDKSEGRGEHYNLIELPQSTFKAQENFSIKSVSAYYQPFGLRDQNSEDPILVRCFEVSATGLNSMDQQSIQKYISQITQGFESINEKSIFLEREYSLAIPTPTNSLQLAKTSLPAQYTKIVFEN